MNIFNNKPDATTKNPNDKVVYNYGETPIYLSQYTRTLSNGGYVEIPFINPKGAVEPNIILFPSQKKFQTNSVAIIKKTTPIRDINYDGYLLIEHVNPSNNEKCYSVILLKTIEGIDEETAVDKLIQYSNKHTVKQLTDGGISVNLNLNPYLSQNNSVLLDVTNNTVIFMKPMLVTSKFNVFTNTPEKKMDFDERNYIEVKAYAKELPAVGVEGMTGYGSRIIEGATDLSQAFDKLSAEDKTALENALMQSASKNPNNSMYIDCQPTTQTDMKDVVVMDGTALNNQSQMQLLSTSINFVVFIIVVALVALTSAGIYKTLIVDIVSTVILDKSKQPIVLKVADFAVLTLAIGLSLWVCMIGVNNDIPIITSIGVFGIIYVILNTIVITGMKFQSPATYSLADPAAQAGPSMSQLFMQLGEMIMDIGKFTWSKKTQVGMIFAVTYAIMFGVCYYAKSYNMFSSVSNKNNEIYNNVVGLGTILSVIFAIGAGYSLRKFP